MINDNKLQYIVNRSNHLFPPCCLDLLRLVVFTADCEDSRPLLNAGSSVITGVDGGLASKFTVITG